MPLRHRGRGVVLAAALLVGLAPQAARAQGPQQLTYPGAAGQQVGKADPKFSQPSLVPGADYTLPEPAEIKAVLRSTIGLGSSSKPRSRKPGRVVGGNRRL